MQVVLIILSVVLLGVIINYAFSPKSSRFLRLAALIALVLIGLSLGVASIIIALSGSNTDAEESRLPIFLEAPTAAPNKSNVVELYIFLGVLAVVIALTIVVAIKDRKKRLEEAKKTGSPRLFQNAPKPAVVDQKAEESTGKAKEDEFSLEL